MMVEILGSSCGNGGFGGRAGLQPGVKAIIISGGLQPRRSSHSPRMIGRESYPLTPLGQTVSNTAKRGAPGAAEIVHIGQAVLAMGGTIEYFRDTVFNYPTLAEAYKVAALDGLNKI